jgi:hypothetical protein
MTRRPLMTGELRKMREMAGDGATVSEAATALGRPHDAVYQWGKKYDLAFRVPPRGCSGSPRLFCPKGHMMTADNIYIEPKGSRRCKECRSAQEKLRRGRRSQKVKPAKEPRPLRAVGRPKTRQGPRLSGGARRTLAKKAASLALSL